MSRPSLLVIGDVILDVIVEGASPRISPESPTPVLTASPPRPMPGGAANVAANIAGLGYRAWLLGIVGVDPAADALRRLLDEHGVGHNLLARAMAGTITKTRFTCCGRQLLRVDDELPLVADQHELAKSMLEQVRLLFAHDPNVATMVVSDYAKGTIPDDLPPLLVAECAARRVRLFVDTKPGRVALYRGATLLKPNYPEALGLLRLDGVVHPAIAAGHVVATAEVAARHIAARYDIAVAVVTCGEHGVVAHAAGVGDFAIPSRRRELYEPTGAGDTFMATLAVASAEDRPLREAVQRANTAAGLAVDRPGTYVLTRDALETEIAESRGPASKRMTLPELLDWLSRKRGGPSLIQRQVVLTNGCFDLLHHGHLSLLRFAKAAGDLLIVAYDSDASVRALKGDDRPIVPAVHRAEFLSFLPEVDAVVEFDGDVEALVRAIKPAALVKGAEYRSRHVPGADYVAAHGGRVEFSPMLANVHTSLIVPRLAAPR